MNERIVSVGILVCALAYLAGSLSLKVGTIARPDAGLFPVAVGFSLLAIAAFQVWQTFRRTVERDEKRIWTQIAPAGIAATIVIYPMLLKALGFLFAAFIVLFVIFRLMRFKTILTSFLTAIVTAILSLIIFAGLLRMVMPGGVMEEFILKTVGFD